MSAAVENTCDLEVGMVVLRSIKEVLTPPKVSKPKVKGVTSKSKISLPCTSPPIIPACTAAPFATASIGSTPLSICLPMYSSTNFTTAGMRVGPPIKIILLISEGFSLASLSACCTGSFIRLMVGLISSSSLALVIFICMCLGPLASAVMKGKLMSVSIVVESSIFAFSAASLTRFIAILSATKSTPEDCLKSFTI